MRNLMGFYFRDEDRGEEEVIYLQAEGDRLEEAALQCDEYMDAYATVIEEGEQYGVLDQFSINPEIEIISLDSYEIQGEDRQKVIALATAWLNGLGLTVTKVAVPDWAITDG